MGLQIAIDLKSVHSIQIPETIYKIYDVLQEQSLQSDNWREMDENTLWNHLCLCILSSNVTYDLAKSALSQLNKLKIFDPHQMVQEQSSQKILETELSKSIYLPQKKDGSFRKYRFPSIRAKNIVNAAAIIYLNGKTIRHFLENAISEENMRNYFADNISGLGLKESSHFLRNIKYSSSLAIIDVHIVSFLKEMGLISANKIAVTPRIYLHLEKIMQQISEINCLNLSILDNAIWHYMKYKPNS
jgi:N-glycosylase/DNA lyase